MSGHNGLVRIMDLFGNPQNRHSGPIVIPAKAGTQRPPRITRNVWVPAFAGMTVSEQI